MKIKKKKTKQNKRNGLRGVYIKLFIFIIFLFLGFLAGFFLYKKNLSSIKPTSISKFVPIPISSVRIPIALFHYVEYVKDDKDTIRKSLSITPFTFKRQIETLRNEGFTFMTPAELADVLDGNLILPKNPIILSFDDGYKDFYTDVFPILKEFKIKAVAYIVSDFIDKPNFMTASQIREIIRSNLVEIGVHTVHHSYIKGLLKQDASFEVNKSKEDIRKMFGINAVSFAYPYGAYDDQALEIVENAGFKTAVTTMAGVQIYRNKRFKLPRIRLGARTGDELLFFLQQAN